MAANYENEKWVALYQSAILELQQSLLAGRISEARTEITKRIEKLFGMRVPISLETPIGQEGDSHLGDLIEDHAEISPADAVVNVNVQERTAKVLRTLSPREEKIIRMRFGMEDGSEHTLEEVGRAFSVTRERIRQIEAKALRKLRHPSRLEKLKSLFDDVRELQTGKV